MSRSEPIRRWSTLCAPALLALLVVSCGGGGSGGGGAATGGGSAASVVHFLGFGFRAAAGVETTTPPSEDLSAFPPSVGAPLDLVVVFHFDAQPVGPFDLASLPVFTTPSDINPAAGPLPGVKTIPAKGTYVLVVDAAAGVYDVEFRPFVPTAPLQLSLSAPANAVPGLFPGSTYTVRVSKVPGSAIGNLQGPGGETFFGTTSNAAAYYPKDAGDLGAPAVLASTPVDGATDFFPATWSTSALDAVTDFFPAGPSDFVLTYDKPLQPTAENLLGRDQDGDGLIEPVFRLSTRATGLIIGHLVPAGSLYPAQPPTPVISAIEPGAGSAHSGADIVLFPPTNPLPATPGALASDRDAGLLYVVFPRDGQTDLFSMADNLLGDPLKASLAVKVAGGAKQALDTGLDDLKGLVVLLDGRLVGFDNGTRRIVELSPTFTRLQANALGSKPGPPVLTALKTAADVGAEGLFLGEAWPAGIEVLDLAQAPSGALVALVRSAPGAPPAIHAVTAIDPDVNGLFLAGEGQLGAELLAISDEYVALEFLTERELLGLNRSLDSIDRISLDSGVLTPPYVTDVASFGKPSPMPDGLGAATTLAFGRMEIDLDVELQSNTSDGAVLTLSPVSVLPIDAELVLLQRNDLTSLSGSSEVNATPGSPKTPLGSVELLRVHTAAPQAGPGAPVDDVFLESFVTKAFEDGQASSTNPLAEWAQSQSPAGVGAGGLRASSGVSESAQLGDFLPVAESNFKPGKAWIRSTPPWPGLSDPEDNPEFVLDMTQANYRVVLLDTDAQAFPLPGGFTPSITQPTTVYGGHFVFRDFIIPEGVQVIARGSNPLRITATGRVEIHGMLDVRGTDGTSDDTFDSGFLPVPGGAAGPGAGRGGDSHPTRFDPNGTHNIDQFVTPETGERGFGPVIDAAGTVRIKQVGGFGGLCTVGYDPNATGYPKNELVAQAAGPVPNSEHQRPPGGGGGSFYRRGMRAHEGTGAYLVQSESTWFPFSKCPLNDKIHDGVYGNDENIAAGVNGAHAIQCVYLTGTTSAPVRFKPGGEPGDPVFVDGDPENDFIGTGGELPVLIGGQGGGGGGSRVDSWRHLTWSASPLGAPLTAPPAPPYYPILAAGSVFFSPTLFDGKGGAGGGGGGSVQLRSFSDIIIGRTGHIDARGGHGGGGEVVQNGNVGGGGGGGSGGAVLLQAARNIVVEAQIGHAAASFTDGDGKQGASIEVSGGFGRESQTDTPSQNYSFTPYTYEFTRSDGGQGGFGLIQLQAGGGDGAVQISDGAFLFAKLRSVMKQGAWTGNGANAQAEHPDWGDAIPPIDDLRYIDMLDYRAFKPESTVGADHYMVLNGSYPPIIPSIDGDNGPYLPNVYPDGSSKTWGDTRMVANAYSGGVPVVRDPEAVKMMKTYTGWDPTTFLELNAGPGLPPGTTYLSSDPIPLSVYLHEPDGTPFTVMHEGVEIFDPLNTVDRLPVVPLDRTPPPIGTKSRGRSQWIDFAGVALRPRNAVSGRTPPFFAGFHGTYNAGAGVPTPTGADGRVRVGAPVPFQNVPAKWVLNAGFDDPGLFPGLGLGQGTPPNPSYNDIKVDAPDAVIGLQDVVTNNAYVTVRFQGARAVLPGSHVPDETSLSPWVSDLAALSGFPLIRFEVEFDLGIDPVGFPFGPQALRPLVDYVRLRASY